jgi:hypothetical protein
MVFELNISFHDKVAIQKLIHMNSRNKGGFSLENCNYRLLSNTLDHDNKI